MAVSIRFIETVVPATVLAQGVARDLFAAQPGLSRLQQRRVAAVLDASAIQTRHTVLAELAGEGARGAGFLDPGTRVLRQVPTGRRNAVYREAAGELFAAAAKQALAAAPGLLPADVTHVVTVSCTGFYAPGPDIEVLRSLGLDPAVQRYHVGFMGCYGAFPALRAAADFCRADPGAVVLAVELCTLHLRSAEHADTVLSCSLFADGGAAAVVTARPAPVGTALLDLDTFASALVVEGEHDMAWTIGDEGFEMVLSGQVPRLVGAHVREALAPLLGPGRGRVPRRRPLGGPPGRAEHPRPGGGRARSGARAAGAVTGGAAPLRQHVQRHRAVRAARPAAGGPHRRGPGLRAGLRPGAQRRERPADPARRPVRRRQ